MQPTIVLIGPPRAGKSTVGKLLAAQLKLPFLDLARAAKDYYAELVYDESILEQAWDDGDFASFLHYQVPFTVHAIERTLQEHHGIVELGALQVAIDDALLDRVRQALQPCQQVVLLLPSPDSHESARILEERGRVLYDGMEINEHFVRHHSNHDLAKLRVYTKGQTPQETCEAIVQLLDNSAPEVFLIGPQGAGKSTQGKLLAERLGRPQIALDMVRWNYYKEIGYERAVQQAIHEREGFAGVYRYWKRFEALRGACGRARPSGSPWLRDGLRRRTLGPRGCCRLRLYSGAPGAAPQRPPASTIARSRRVGRDPPG
jgi:hypothetical protein